MKCQIYGGKHIKNWCDLKLTSKCLKKEPVLLLENEKFKKKLTKYVKINILLYLSAQL
jgi:hypothetical protein